MALSLIHIFTLPEVQELDPSFMEFVNGPDGVVASWLAAGASGWRLDVADELPDGFLDALRNAARAAKPDALVLGEEMCIRDRLQSAQCPDSSFLYLF